MRIVIFKFNHLGDNVVFVPVLQQLRRQFPRWELVLLTTPAEAELYQGPGGPLRILTAPKRAFDKCYRRPWQLLGWVWRVRRLKPDACLIAFDQGSVAHLVARLSGARVRIGGRRPQARLNPSLSAAIPMPPDQRAVTWNWETGRALARAMGDVGSWPASPPVPDLHHLAPPVSKARGRRRIVVHAGASSATNRWPTTHFAAVATALARDHEVVWIVHGASEAPAPAGTRRAVVGTIGEFARWLTERPLFLGNNSGPMHVANALGCPGIVVTGATARGWDPYWHPDRWTVLRHPDLPCQPCERLNQELRGCRNLGNPLACLTYWTPEKVEAACRERLDFLAANPA